MHILMLFLDGIGLGDDNPEINPFAVANMPNLIELTNGERWLKATGRQQTERATFVPTDPRMGVAGRPQSGTGQAAIVIGKNVPQIIGRHYGPKPDEATRQLIRNDNIFKRVNQSGKKAALIEAYPPRFHEWHDSGKGLYASYQQAAFDGGQKLFGLDEIRANKALAVDWTNQGLSERFSYTDLPIHTPYEAGKLLVEISREYDFAFHSHWFTDVIGHRGPFEEGVRVLELFDNVMGGVLDEWDDSEGLIIITSDHGNMENIGDRKHTENDVPTLIIGDQKEWFAEGLQTLADFVPRMETLLLGTS